MSNLEFTWRCIASNRKWAKFGFKISRVKYKGFVLPISTVTAVAMSVNAYFATDGMDAMPVTSLQDVEAVAAGPEWNSWYHWISYGFTKDEREEKRVCPTSSSWWGCVSGSGGNSSSGNVSGGSGQTNSADRYEIICAYGNDNCTAVDC